METRHNHTRVLVICSAITLGMLGMSYAAVPLYQLFCQVTGYAGTTQRAESPTGVVLEKTIRVAFDANISNDLPWDFAPVQKSVTVKIGESKQVEYRARNMTGSRTFGTASFNVTPQQAGAYFNKIDCFCFTEQELKGGQTVKMPVVFFVDPEIVNDPLLKDIDTITLSYTFYEDKNAEPKLSQIGAVGENRNSKL